MKNIILFIMILFCNYAGAQSLSQEEKERIIADLDSVNSLKVTVAILDVIDHKIQEALPKVEQNFWLVSPYTQDMFLEALDILGSSLACQYSIIYLDSIDYKLSAYYDRLYIDNYKASAIEILLKNNDFSRVDYVFYLIERDSPNYNLGLPLLPYIIKNDPIHSQYAVDLLLSVINNAAEANDRLLALAYYKDLFGDMARPIILRLYNENNYKIRARILIIYFFEDKNPEYHKALIESLFTEQNNELRFRIALNMMFVYRTPSDKKSIMDFLPFETDPDNKLDFKRFLRFRPLEPDSTISLTIMIDSLISYNSQCYAFSWLQNSIYYEYLSDKLTLAKNYLLSKDSLTCAKEIKSFQESIEQVHADSARSYPKYVNDDAYKFLYYYPQYILDRLPEIPVFEGPIIESLSPSITITKTKDFTLTVYGSNFTKKSEVYWDGKKKKTKFISENVLEAEIKDKDIKKEGTYIVTVVDEDGSQTEALEFKAYKDLPEQLIPVLNCVEDLGKKKYRAWFGYENYNDGIVLLEGKENEIKGGKKKKGDPPVIFMPGIHEKVFSVEYDKNEKLTWGLGKEKAEVTEGSPPCN